MSRSRKISFIDLLRSAAAPPPRPPPTNINMHIIRAGVPAGIGPEPAGEIRVLEVDDLRRQPYHPAVDRGDLAVAVGVDRDIGGIAVLVLAIALGAGKPAGAPACSE